MNIEALGTEAMHCLLNADHQGFKEKFISKVDPHTIQAVYEVTRDLARKAFASGDFNLALQHYTGLLAFATSDERAKLFSNRSLCCLKLRRFEDALEEAKKAIASDPKWEKAWFRAGRAFLELNKVQEALASARYALKLKGFNDPRNVVSDNPEVRDIHNLYKLALEEDIKIKRKQRYETNYDRFHKLADELTALEHAAEQAELQAQPIIEFAPGLSDEQKHALTLQLTGQYDERLSAKVLEQAEKRVVIDLGVDRPMTLNPKHRLALGSMLQLQYEASYGQRLISLLDSGLAAEWARMVRRYLKQQTFCSSIVFLGYESLLSAAMTILDVRKESLRVHLCSRSGVPAAYDFLMRLLEANTPDPITSVNGQPLPADDFVLLHNRRELLSEERPTESSTPESLDEEEALASRGESLVGSQIVPIPRSPDVVILDPASLEGYLLGPLNPIYDLRCFHKVTLFPRKICVYADFLNIHLPDHLSKSLSVQSALQWSLLPQKLPNNLLMDRVEVDSKLLYILDDNCELPPDGDLRFEWNNVATSVNAVRFYLTIDDGKDTFDTRDRTPHFWWLVNKPGQPSQPEAATQVVFKFCKGQIAAVRICDKDGATLLQSDPIVCNSCDRYLWNRQLNDKLYGPWSASLRKFRDTVISKTVDRSQSRMTATKVSPQLDLDFLHLDVGSASSVIATLISVLEKPSEAVPSNVTTRLLSFDVSQGTCRLIKGAVRNTEALKLIKQNCWRDTPTLLRDHTEWHDAKGDIINDKLQDNFDDVRDWLCGRDSTTRAPLRWSIECGSVRTLRPAEETPDTRMALCALYGVSPGTPGLDNLAGCQILQKPVSAVVIGDIATLPSDGLSQGIIPTVLYARRALANRWVEFFPANLSIMGVLIKLSDKIDDLDVSPLRAVRNPARSAGAIANNVTDSHCFNYGQRTEMNGNDVKFVSNNPRLLAKFDFNESDEQRLLAPLLKSRLIPENSSSEEADGILIWSEWTLVEGQIVGNPPHPYKHRVHHDTELPQMFQLLPRRPVCDMEFLPLPSMTDFVITWKPQAADPSYIPRNEQQIAASTSMVLATLAVKQDELAMQVGQQLLTSPKSAKEMADTAIGLVREGEECIRNHLLDSSIVNNLLYATLA